MRAFLCFNIGDFETAYKKGMDFFEKNTAGLDPAIENKLRLVYEEMFVNTIQANENSGAEMSLEIDSDDDRIKICMKDKGIEFDPFKKDEPDITLSAEERGIGGLGIFIFKKMTDFAEYEYKSGFNILTYGMYLSDKKR